MTNFYSTINLLYFKPAIKEFNLRKQNCGSQEKLFLKVNLKNINAEKNNDEQDSVENDNIEGKILLNLADI